MISMDSPLCIDGNVVLAACSARETLPQNGDVPFDIFTSCLTTPVVMAALWFIRRTRNFSMQHTEALLEQLRNEQERKMSIAYNLNWILTTITDTIAYNSFPKQIFLGLFRDDNLLANTMRHFMLAQRVLRLWGCNPVSFPPLPPTHSHPLWNTFDLALDVALKKMSRQKQFQPQMQMQMQMQLSPYSSPDLQYKQILFPMSPKGIQPKLNPLLVLSPSPSLQNQQFISLVSSNILPPISLSDKFNQIESQQQDKSLYQLSINQHNDELKQQQQQEMSIIDYKSGLAQSTTSTQHFIDQEDGEDELQFFYEHFNSFEEWLRLGPLEGSPPVYLPIVLHGLQNRQLRSKCVQLLEQFIALGERALRQAMHAGALLMCLRLFSTKGDIHYHIPSIWARILAQAPFLADQIVANDLFFLSSTLNEEAVPALRASSAFVLSRILSVMKHIRRGYIMKDTFLELIRSPDRHLRACALLCIAQQASKSSVECNAAVHLPNFSLIFQALKDPCVEVRAAAVNCLSCFGNVVNGDPSTSKDLHTLPQVEMLVPEKLLDCISDGSVLVRREVLAALQNYIISHYQAALNFYGLDMLLAQLDANTSPFQVFLPFQDKQNKNKNQSKKIIKMKKNVVDNKNQDESEEEIEQNPQIEIYRSQLSFHRKLILGNGENIEFQSLQDSNNQFLNQQPYQQISQQSSHSHSHSHKHGHSHKDHQSSSSRRQSHSNSSDSHSRHSLTPEQSLKKENAGNTSSLYKQQQQQSSSQQQSRIKTNQSQLYINDLNGSQSFVFVSNSQNRQQPLQQSPIRQQNNVVIDPSVSVQVLQPSSSSSSSSSQSTSDSMISKLKFKIKYFPKAQNVGEAFIAAWRGQAIFCTDHFQEFNKSAKEFSTNFRGMLLSLIKQRTSNQQGQQQTGGRSIGEDQRSRSSKQSKIPSPTQSPIYNQDPQQRQQLMNDRYDANDIRQRPPMPTHLCSLIFNWCSEHWKRPCVGGIAIKEKKEIKLKGWRYKRQPLFPRSYYEYGGTNREFILNREINQRQKEIENGINVMSTRKYNSITDKTQRKDEKEDEMKKNEGNEEQFVDYCFGEVQLSDNFNKNRNNKERERKTNDDEQEDEGDEDADSDSYKQNSDIERGKSKLKKSQKSMEKNTDFKSQTNTNMIRFGEQKRNQSDYIYLEEEDFVFIEDEEDEDDYENSDEYEKNTIFQNKNGKEEKIQHQLERQDSETNEFVVISQEGINNNQSIASQQTISSASSASSPLYPQTPNSVQSRQQQQQQQNQVLPFGSLKLIGSKQAIHPVPLPHPLTVQDQSNNLSNTQSPLLSQQQQQLLKLRSNSQSSVQSPLQSIQQQSSKLQQSSPLSIPDKNLNTNNNIAAIQQEGSRVYSLGQKSLNNQLQQLKEQERAKVQQKQLQKQSSTSSLNKLNKSQNTPIPPPPLITQDIGDGFLNQSQQTQKSLSLSQSQQSIQTQSSLFPISQTQQKGIKSQSPLSAIQHIDNEYQSESRQRSESMNSNKSNLSKLSQNSESEGNRNMSRQGIADNEMDDINNQSNSNSLIDTQPIDFQRDMLEAMNCSVSEIKQQQQQQQQQSQLYHRSVSQSSSNNQSPAISISNLSQTQHLNDQYKQSPHTQSDQLHQFSPTNSNLQNNTKVISPQSSYNSNTQPEGYEQVSNLDQFQQIRSPKKASQTPQISQPQAQQSSSQQQQIIQQQSSQLPIISITDNNVNKNGNQSNNKKQHDFIPKIKYKKQKQPKTTSQEKLLVQLQLKIQPQFQTTLYKSFISNSHPGTNIASSQLLSSSSSASTASLFSQQQAQLQSSQSGIGIGMNPNISINERDRINTINVSSMSTSNLGFVYNPNSNAGDEFNLVHIAQIQFTNGVTHTTFHPKERVVAIGSSKRNIVGIYEVSFQVPKQSSSSTQGEQENQRERNKDRGKEKDKEKDKEKEREKKNTQLNKVNNVRIFQIPPPAPPQLHIEKVDEQIKKYLTIKKLEPLTHPQEYTPMSFPRLATLDFLNEGSDTRMIISTQDSAVKVLSFPDDNNACRLITSFFAFPLSLFAQDGLQSNINQQLSRQSSVSSMINVVTPSPYQQQSQQAPQSQLFNPTFLLSWSQRTGLLAAAGEPLQYRIWDVAQEQCILDQETGFDSPSSSLALDQLGWTLAIGSHYGVVRLFDRREYDVEPVMSLCLDDNPLRPSNQDFALSDDVVNLAFTATRQHELIAAARNTQIALFDLRMPKQRQRRKDLITHNNTNMNQSLRINNNGCFFPYSLLSLNGGIIPLKKGQSLAQGFAQRFSSSTLSQVDKSLSQNAMINPDLYYNEESPSDQSTIPQWLWNSRGKGHAYLVNRRLGSHYMSTTNCFAKVDNLSNILHDTQGQSSDGIAQGDVRSSRQQIASTGQHDQDIEHTAAFAIHPLFPYALLATTERKNNYAFGLQNGELIQYERACAQLGTSQVIGSAQKLQLGMDGDPPVQTMAWHPNEGALVVSYGTKHANVFVKA